MKRIFLFAVLLVIFAAVTLFLFSIQLPKQQADCNSFSFENCPKECVVCPPCAYCSSISCRTEQFCNSIGFDRNWHSETVAARNSLPK